MSKNKVGDIWGTARGKKKRLRAENQLLSLLTCGMDGTLCVSFYSIV